MRLEVYISLEFLWNSDVINKYQYVLHTNNCRCKRKFFSRIGNLNELRPSIWLSLITLRCPILVRIPLVKGSARPRDLHLKTHNTHKTYIYALTGFEHTNPASRRSWNLALNRVAPTDEESHWLNILNNSGIRRKVFDRACSVLSVSGLSVCVYHVHVH